MRQIKFRAWDKIAKKFVYWYFNGTISTFIFHTNGQGIWDYNLEEPEEFTGLKDKNGKEIYEGDIVKYTYLMEGRFYETHKVTDILEVTFEEGKFSVAGLSTFDRKDMLMKDLEVIGNKFKNPELLKK